MDKLRFGYLVLSAGALAFAGCVVNSNSGDDSGTATDTGTPGADTGVGTDSAPTDGTIDDTTPPPGDADPDTAPPPPPPDNPNYSSPPSEVAVRFVAATSELATGLDFDVCWKQDPDPLYSGPIAKAMGGSFSAPEITRFFKLTGAVAGKPIKVRLVKKDAPNCDATNRFKSSAGFDLAIIDDTAHNLEYGYNTVVIYGAAVPSSGYSLNAFLYQDPTTKATNPIMQFFMSLNGGATMSLNLYDTSGKAFSLTGGADISFGTYLEIPLGASYTSPVTIKTLEFKAGSSTFTFSPPGYSVYNGYYWMIAYDTLTKPKAYVCNPEVEIAKPGALVQTGCTLYSPGG